MYRLCGKDGELVWCNIAVTFIIYAIVLINNPLYGLTVSIIMFLHLNCKKFASI